MLVVYAYGYPANGVRPTVGSVTWDGTRLVCDPPGAFFEKFLAHPIADPDTGERVTPNTDPERFLGLLHHRYGGTGFAFSPPQRTTPGGG